MADFYSNWYRNGNYGKRVLTVLNDRSPIVEITNAFYPLKYTLYTPLLQSLTNILENVESQYLVMQHSKYSDEEMKNTLKLFELVEKEIIRYNNATFINSSSNNNPNWRKCDNIKIIRRFNAEIRWRIQIVKRERVLRERHFSSFLGNFEDSISPKMIHHILTWLKRKDPEKIELQKIRGKNNKSKEEIISKLNEIGIKMDSSLLCSYIDDNNPMHYLKEWDIKSHKNGKRLKNSEIRKLYKIEFIKREKSYFREPGLVKPTLRDLPLTIENHIMSYLHP